MKEKDFCKNKITPWLKKQNIYYFKPRGGAYSSQRGVPDYILCVGGCFIGMEAKTDKGKLSALQELEAEKIQAAGGFPITVRPSNWDVVKTRLLSLKG